MSQFINERVNASNLFCSLNSSRIVVASRHKSVFHVDSKDCNKMNKTYYDFYVLIIILDCFYYALMVLQQYENICFYTESNI